MTIQELEQLWQKEIAEQQEKYCDIDLNLSDVKVELHNATWCPDCVRECSELLAIKAALGSKAPEISLISYEDKEHYMSNKASLDINCLPTIVFTRNEQEFARIEEDSQGKMLGLIS